MSMRRSRPLNTGDDDLDDYTTQYRGSNQPKVDDEFRNDPPVASPLLKTGEPLFKSFAANLPDIKTSPFSAFGKTSTTTDGTHPATDNTTNNTTQQPPASSNLSGNTTQPDQAPHHLPGSGGSIGNLGGDSAQQQKPASEGMFASSGSTAQQPQQQPASGGLFGNLGANSTQQQPQQQQPASGGLFGNLGGTPTQQQQQQQPASGGLFGNLGGNATQQQQQPAPSGGLFGNLGGNATQQQQQPASGGLFGNLGGNSAQQQPQPASGGLFGSLGGNSTQPQQQPQPASGGLFGNLGGNAAQPQQQQKPLSTQGGLFGAQNTQQNSGLGASSLFGSTTGPTSQSAPPLQNGQQPQAGLVPSAPTALFQNLLERGKKRTADTNPNLEFGGLPSLQLGLSDIASKVRNLGGANGFSKSGKGTDSRAHYLLAASGVPRASTLRDLDDFPMQGDTPANISGPPPLDADIDAYVSQLQAKSNADLFREYMEQTQRDFDAFVEERYHMNLDHQRQRVYEHFGLAKPNENLKDSRSAFEKSSRKTKGQEGGHPHISFGASSMSRSLLGESTGRSTLRQSQFSDIAERRKSIVAMPQEDPFFRAKQEKYSASVKQLNSSRLQGLLYPVIEEFAKIELETGNDAPQHLTDAYKALREITQENKNVRIPADKGAVRERQYANDYLGASTSAQASGLRKQILNGSRKHLEDSFFKTVEDIVNSNPREGNVGGVPTKINKIRAYVRIRVSQKDLGPESDALQMLGNDYCWVLIFYLLRAGLVQEAAQYVTENDRAIKSMDRQFSQYMTAYASDPDRRLPRYLQQRIEGEYSARSAEESIDPYRLACLKMVGRCNLGSKNFTGFRTSLEDWMWMILSLAREVPRTEEIAGESFNLEDAQALIDNIGQRHFQGNDETVSGYSTFFLLQILVGMFEKAVAWLHTYNHVAAAHFAIALDYYGLLRTADFDPTETRLLTFTTTELPQLSFARLLGYYTSDFRTAQPEAATDYLTLIALNSDLPGAAGRAQAAVCHEALKELVLETREFAVLLGDVLPDGKRIKGVIEQRLPLIKPDDEDEFMRTLIMQAASVAEDSGRTTDAVLLYHLAGVYDKVILLINRVLSESISMELGRGSLRLQPLRSRKSLEDQQKEQSDSKTSMSLTSIDDPATLAKSMIALYNRDASYFKKIGKNNREACGMLIRMSEVKSKIEAGNWLDALTLIDALQLLPLEAKGDISLVRAASQAFNSMPPVISRTIGNLLLWTIMCLGRQRVEVNKSAYPTQRSAGEELLVCAKDMMIFAGLIRYKLPPDVFDVLARAGQDIGAY